MKTLGLIAVLLALASPSFALTYHVGPGGNDFSLGTSYGTRWQTINQANKTAKPGDKVLIYDGGNGQVANYTHFPNPDSGGSNPNGRIRFVGASLSGDPTTDTTFRKLIRVAQGDITKGNFTIQGMSVNGSLTINSINANFDSLLSLHTLGGVATVAVGKNNAILNCVMSGVNIEFGRASRTGNVPVGVFGAADFNYFARSGSDTLYASAYRVSDSLSRFASVQVGDRVIGARVNTYALVVQKIGARIRISTTVAAGSDSLLRIFAGANTRNTFSGNSLPALGIGYSGTTLAGLFFTRGIDSCTFERNQINADIPANSTNTDGPTHAVMNYTTNDCRWADNRKLFKNNSPVARYCINFRDFSARDTVRDTLSVRGPGYWNGNLASSGNYPNTVTGIVLDSLWYYSDAGGEPLYAQDRVNNLTIRYCVIITPNAQCLMLNDIKGRTKIENNTFRGDPYEGVIKFNTSSTWADYNDTVSVKNNIISASRFTPGPDFLPSWQWDQCGGGACANGSRDMAIWWEPDMFDSLKSCSAGGLACTYPRIASNNNLFAYHGWRKKLGDRDIGHNRISGDGWHISQPGDSTSDDAYIFGTGNTQYHWEGTYHKDSLSIHADPLFTDSSVTANATKRTGTNFNPAIRITSPAISAASDGTTIGALDYVANAVMTFEPQQFIIGRSSTQVSFVITNIGGAVGSSSQDIRDYTNSEYRNSGSYPFVSVSDFTDEIDPGVAWVGLFTSGNLNGVTIQGTPQPNGDVLVGYVEYSGTNGKVNVPIYFRE